MEEDEEVDIVGGFDDFLSRSEREISNLSSGQILSCDYTVHPRWLNDNNDGTELWPENLPKQSSQDEMEMVQDEVVIEEPAPIDFNWVEETEEISNCDDIILEQDIPASLEEEVVTNSGAEVEYDDMSDAYQSSGGKTKQRRPNNTSTSSVEESLLPSPPRFISINPRSLLKRHYFDVNEQLTINSSAPPQVKFKQKLMINKNALKLNQPRFAINASRQKSILKSNATEPSTSSQVPVDKATGKSKKPTTKFKKSVTLMDRNVPQNTNFQAVMKKLKEKKKPVKQRKPKGSAGSGSIDGAGGKNGKRGGKKFVDLHGGNITINHEADNVVASSSSLHATFDLNLVKSELEPVVIKVERETESDVEIDIESESDDPVAPSEIKVGPVKKFEQPIANKSQSEISIKQERELELPIAYQSEFTGNDKLDTELNSMNVPNEAVRLSPQSITDLEKYFHYEFFEGRQTKTPERYMKIRAYILNAWNDNKPSYVSKTTVRSGLKHCGDVNCISRIHSLLEQIGAINFGHASEHFDYIRPLSKLKEYFLPTARGKQSNKNDPFANCGSMVMERKQRMKNSSTKSPSKLVDANYTVSHTNGVTTVVFASLAPEKDGSLLKMKQIKPELELIECMRYSRDQIAPFQVSISLSTLLCLQLHSLSSRCEVMGFLGGSYSKSVGRNKISITRYKPCNTSAQSGTMCEMCPVSQVEQSTKLVSEGYDLVGWFHSHPLFEPNPSRTDVRTQAEMQQQFSAETCRPFVGLIMGCIDMKYNCMYVMPEDLQNFSSDTIPYALDVDVIKNCSNLKNEMNDIFSAIDRETDYYTEAARKFSTTAQILLNQYGYSADILNDINNYL